MRLCLLFESDHIGPVTSESMARAAVMEKLDEMARAEDVILLENYCSPTVAEMLQSLVGDGKPCAVRWFDAADGVQTVRGLLAYLKRKPNTVRGVSRDLTVFEKALAMAQHEGIRFRLLLDYGDIVNDEVDED